MRQTDEMARHMACDVPRALHDWLARVVLTVDLRPGCLVAQFTLNDVANSIDRIFERYAHRGMAATVMRRDGCEWDGIGVVQRPLNRLEQRGLPGAIRPGY